MQRILHVTTAMNYGGIETLLMNIYRNIDRTKVQFDFLLQTKENCDYNQEILDLGGKIYYVPGRRKGIIKNRVELDSFFNAHPEYKIIHLHTNALSYVEPLKKAKKYGVPVRVIHGHSTNINGNPLHKVLHKINQLTVSSYATTYFTCSDAVARWIYGKNKLKKIDYKVIKNGIETHKFEFSTRIRSEIRKKFNIEDKLVLGHTGRFVYPKNHNFLVDVFKQVYELDNNAILLLIGDGELRSQIEQKISDIGLSNNVIFTGVRADVSDLLQAMDVFVFPSHYEGLPVTLIEAQAAGLPCVISNNITNEIQVTNLIHKIPLEQTTQVWAKKILEVSQENERKNSAQAVRLAGYDIKNTAKELENFYIGS